MTADEWRVAHEARKAAVQERNINYVMEGLSIIASFGGAALGGYYGAEAAGGDPSSQYRDTQSTTEEGQNSPGQGKGGMLGGISAVTMAILGIAGAIAYKMFS